MNNKNKRVVKKRKLKTKAILISFLFIIVISLCIYYLFQIKITNIYVIDNELLSDYEIIKLAKLEKYPKTMDNSCKEIKERLEKNDLIKKAKVEKKGLLNEVYIYVEENKPLFYYQVMNKVISKDGKKVNGNYNVVVVTNEISVDIYDEFLEKMSKIDSNTMSQISEIKYDPNDIDKKRFYLTMNDGNYVYLTLNKFERINNYLEIVKTFNNAKGVLYLDSGEYFKLFNE